MDADEATRVRQGASPGTSPDILRTLATDPSVTVRASLAMNPALPPQVTAVLAGDADARVRSIIGRKLASLTPGLSGPDRERVQQDAVANLTALVADAALRVRATIAEAVRDMPDGPRDIILHLARDPSVMVSEPVILFSPMLTAEDLVALIASRPPSVTLTAVARRPRIDATVSDAIVETSDTAAITALLSNRTAQIREATLDALAAQSEEQTEWQEPLVRRPHLPKRAARILSEIVTSHLLEVLAARPDLEPKLSRELQALLDKPRTAAFGIADALPDDSTAQTALPHAVRLHEAGRLDEQAILDALRRNAIGSATAMLAVKADVPLPVVERACALRSAKAMVALAWKAGLSMTAAVVLQAMLGRLSPDLVLRPEDGGGFPLPIEELRWQLSFLGIGGQGPKRWSPPRRPA
nr:DUF2336 domain-containing protein [uncultured Rhodopila sp.]